MTVTPAVDRQIEAPTAAEAHALLVTVTVSRVAMAAASAATTAQTAASADPVGMAVVSGVGIGPR
ncbi:hypothetical protein, partial [Micromonospora polyrhachis]